MHNQGQTWLDGTRVCPMCKGVLIALIMRIQIVANTFEGNTGLFTEIKEKRLYEKAEERMQPLSRRASIQKEVN